MKVLDKGREETFLPKFVKSPFFVERKTTFFLSETTEMYWLRSFSAKNNPINGGKMEVSDISAHFTSKFWEVKVFSTERKIQPFLTRSYRIATFSVIFWWKCQKTNNSQKLILQSQFATKFCLLQRPERNYFFIVP